MEIQVGKSAVSRAGQMHGVKETQANPTPSIPRNEDIVSPDITSLVSLLQTLFAEKNISSDATLAAAILPGDWILELSALLRHPSVVATGTSEATLRNAIVACPGLSLVEKPRDYLKTATTVVPSQASRHRSSAGDRGVPKPPQIHTSKGPPIQFVCLRGLLFKSRNTVVLRNIQPGTRAETLLALLRQAPSLMALSVNQELPLNIRQEVNNTWFVDLPNSEVATEVAVWLRSQKLEGKPLQVGIKASHALQQLVSAQGHSMQPYTPAAAAQHTWLTSRQGPQSPQHYSNTGARGPRYISAEMGLKRSGCYSNDLNTSAYPIAAGPPSEFAIWWACGVPAMGNWWIPSNNPLHATWVGANGWRGRNAADKNEPNWRCQQPTYCNAISPSIGAFTTPAAYAHLRQQQLYLHYNQPPSPMIPLQHRRFYRDHFLNGRNLGGRSARPHGGQGPRGPLEQHQRGMAASRGEEKRVFVPSIHSKQTDIVKTSADGSRVLRTNGLQDGGSPGRKNAAAQYKSDTFEATEFPPLGTAMAVPYRSLRMGPPRKTAAVRKSDTSVSESPEPNCEATKDGIQLQSAA